MPPDKIHRMIILGSGPAGLTAAIYAARADMAPLVIQGADPGGQLTTTTVVENFPGFPEGVDGPGLMEQMEAQARRFGTEFVTGEATAVDLGERPFTVSTSEGEFRSHSLIIATGSSPRRIGLPNERSLMGRGVSICATCDGFFFRDKDIVVVGGGDTAVEESVFLTRFAKHVTVVHRRDTLRASPTLQQRAFAHDQIEFRYDTVVTAIHGTPEEGVKGVTLQHQPGGEEEELPCQGVFIAIGHTPNTSLFEGQLEMDKNGYLSTVNHTATSIPGVFAAGDVQDPIFRQAVTAAGSGCMAALEAQRFLEEIE